MAEGFARELGKGVIEPYSAGLFPVGVNPYAVKVMIEQGIDISRQTSNPINLNFLNEMDLIITLCGNAEAQCPATPTHIKRFHWPIDDPVGTVGPEATIMEEFRKAREEIRKRIVELIENIKKTP